jgi:acyl-[acyl-carrier-protein]-phospholipid O-acyltransferase / long-chain-fatty-acid--[acyl-carrier-protein] ligase
MQKKIIDTDIPSITKIMLMKRFSALFVTQFLTSFNDNFFKNAIVALLTFGLVTKGYDDSTKQNMVIFAGMCFVLPYFIFSALAGKLADKYDRISQVRIIKIAEILILALGGYGFIIESIPLMFAMLFLMGTHSTFFSPIKFGLLPVYLHKNALVGGNALIEMATFLAIILGTIAGTQVILMPQNSAVISLAIMVVLALWGLWVSLKMPTVPIADKDMPMSKNPFSHIAEVFGLMQSYPQIFKYIIAGSWFWFFAAVMMTLFPLYIKDTLNMNKDVYTVFLVLFSVGVGVGSVFCAKILHGAITARYSALCSVVMGLTTIFVGLISKQIAVGEAGTLQILFQHSVSWYLMIGFTIISATGGAYIVPFFALVQDLSPTKIKSRIIAGNNVMNAIAMTSGALYIFLLKYLSFSIPAIMVSTGILSLVGAMVVTYVTPDCFFRRLKNQ